MKKRGKISVLRSKRSQITIFIILGIILLFSSALVLYIKKQVEGVPIEVRASVEQVPLEVKPVQDFVTLCVEQVGENGIRILGSHGGRIDTSQFKADAANPTESDAVYFVPGIKVPYWYYMSGPSDCFGDCSFTENIPSLTGTAPDSFESQINRYVNENFKECLGSFQNFKQEGFDIAEVSDVTTKTTVGANNVYIEVDYVIDVTKDNVKQRMTRYVTALPVNLKKSYELAVFVVQLEKNTNFLEKLTLELVGIFSDVDSNKLPPQHATELAQMPSVVGWTVNSVKALMQQILLSSMSQLKIISSMNYNRVELPDPLAQQLLFDNYVLPVEAGKDYKELQFFSYYMNWPIYLNINNAKTVRPEGFSLAPILPFGVQRYDAAYDISYPMVFELKDPNAFNGKGFSFMFALEANIRDNLPLKADFTSPPPANFGENLFCNPEQRISGNITVNVKDAMTGEQLSDVAVNYRCVETSCAMGLTSFGELKMKFPQCAGGVVQFSKDGYFGKAVQLTTSEGEDGFVNAELYPLRPVEISVMKEKLELHTKTVSSTSKIGKTIAGGEPGAVINQGVYKEGLTQLVRWFEFNPAPAPLDPDEKVVLMITRIHGTGDDELVSTVTIDKDHPTASINLVPGDYEVTGNLILNKKIIVPKDKLCFNIGIWPLEVPKCQDLEEIRFDNGFPRGGISFTQELGTYWRVTKDDAKKDKLTFYVLSMPDGFTIAQDGTTNLKHDDIDMAGKVDDYSKQYRSSLEPGFG